MTRAFEVVVPVACSPDAVRAWWTDIDPSTVVSHDADGTLHIRARFGALSVTETFRVEEDGSWGFVTRAPFGIDLRDRFRVEAAGATSVLRVRCEMGARSWVGRVALPFYFPMAKSQFRARWHEMARQCERDSATA